MGPGGHEKRQVSKGKKNQETKTKAFVGAQNFTFSIASAILWQFFFDKEQWNQNDPPSS